MVECICVRIKHELRDALRLLFAVVQDRFETVAGAWVIVAMNAVVARFDMLGGGAGEVWIFERIQICE